MRFLSLNALVAGLVTSASIFLGSGRPALTASQFSQAAPPAASLTIDYPADGSIFPPEITPPTFIWHEDTDEATHWVVEVRFADRTPPLRINADGEHQHIGDIDPDADAIQRFVPLSPEQAAMRTWKPDPSTWARIKLHSVRSPATINIEGFTSNDPVHPLSNGFVSISTSTDPVGAPIFYRDVPLATSTPTTKGGIQPLPPSALPLIKWKLRSISEPQSHTVMESLHTCANCHSFSPDGKTMGIDVDGPRNDKGLYAIVPITKQMAIRNQDTVRWSAFQEDLNAKTFAPSVKRFGFMSQVSPNGRYVITSIGQPALGHRHDKEHPNFMTGISDRLFSVNYNHIDFTQVFYPTRGILGWYDRLDK